MELSEKIKDLRKKSNMTLQELADKIGVNVSTVQRWEKNDIKNMRRDKIELLANALNTSPAYLMGWTDTITYSSELEPIDMPDILTRQIPLIGTTAAGTPIEAINNDEYIDISSEIDCDCALRVKGDSMVNAGIYNGDIALIRLQEMLDNGQIGVILVNNEATLKRFYQYSDTVVLRPCNETYEDLVYTADNVESFRIYGKCVGVLHKVR